MKVAIADLINTDLLKPGTVVLLRTLEGVITEQGLIRASGANGLGVVDYRTPTAWSRVVCKINSSGWRQIKLKDEKQITLYSIKLKYIEKRGGDARLDDNRPAKRIKLTNRQPVPNTAQIPQQIQFITSPLQAQFNQQHQHHFLSMPMAIVQPPKPVDGDPTAQTALTTGAHVSAPMIETPVSHPQAGYMKFKLAPPPVKTKMLELLVYVEDPNGLPFMLNTTASSFDSLHYVLLESFPQYRGKPFDIGVWSDQWGEFVKPPQSWDQFPSKTKILVKTFGLIKWQREYEPPAVAGTTTSTADAAAAPAAGQQTDVAGQPAPADPAAFVPVAETTTTAQ